MRLIIVCCALAVVWSVPAVLPAGHADVARACVVLAAADDGPAAPATQRIAAWIASEVSSRLVSTVPLSPSSTITLPCVPCVTQFYAH